MIADVAPFHPLNWPQTGRLAILRPSLVIGWIMKTILPLAAACAASFLLVACAGDGSDPFEPSESEVEAAIERLALEINEQNPLLCECFTTELGYLDAGNCRQDRAITQNEASCILDAFALDRSNAADWLGCHIDAESRYNRCIASFTCEDEFGDCDQTRTDAIADCPSLSSSLQRAWDDCQIPPEDPTPEVPDDLGDTVEEVIAAIYSAYLQEDQVLCACFAEFGFDDADACLATRGFSDAEVDCRSAVYESYGAEGLESLECKGIADVGLAACQGNVVCEDSDARQACLTAWGTSVADCPDLPGDGEADAAACIGIPDPE